MRKNVTDAKLERVLGELQKLLALLREGMKEEWDRVLPFQELISDRWERARFLGFGEGTSIYESSLVFGDVKVGAHTWIGPFTILDGSGGLEIGDYCSISTGVQIYSHDSVEWALTGGETPIKKAPTKIGSRCYLGPNVVVGKGVTIGDGCVIGAQSLVLSDVPAGKKAMGIPAKVVGNTDDFTRKEIEK